MDKFYSFLILCTITIVDAKWTPTISHITQKQIRDIGDQVDLACAGNYDRNYPVMWVKYDQAKSQESIPLSSNAGLIIKDSRFSHRFDEATGTYTLSIKDIQENDAGFYQCQVLITVTNKLTAEVELQVRRPPIISDNSTRSLVASEGEKPQSALTATQARLEQLEAEAAAATREVAAATREVAAATREVAAATREVAAATREVAASTREVAAATREAAAATREVAAATREEAVATHRIATPPHSSE